MLKDETEGVTVAATLRLRLRLAVSCVAEESVALTVKLNCPAVDGVPPIAP
jgi:hypothetical protein